MQVVINKKFGGFDLSREAQDLYCAFMDIDTGKWNQSWGFYADFNIQQLNRTDAVLIAVVEYLGEDVDTVYSKLSVVDVPDDVEWYIEDYDGFEHIAEKHRTWS